MTIYLKIVAFFLTVLMAVTLYFGLDFGEKSFAFFLFTFFVGLFITNGALFLRVDKKKDFYVVQFLRDEYLSFLVSMVGLGQIFPSGFMLLLHHETAWYVVTFLVVYLTTSVLLFIFGLWKHLSFFVK